MLFEFKLLLFVVSVCSGRLYKPRYLAGNPMVSLLVAVGEKALGLGVVISGL
jgi:hypothetical protein